MFKYRVPTAALLLAAFFTTACDDDDDDPVTPTATTFSVALTRQAETVACAGGSATATGTGTVTINSANTSVAVGNLTFSNLSAAATAGHIHFGAAGVAGPAVFDFGANPTSPVTMTFTATNYPATTTGIPATFGAFITAMKSGQAYINIHTAACPDGEIRGQLVVVP